MKYESHSKEELVTVIRKKDEKIKLLTNRLLIEERLSKNSTKRLKTIQKMISHIIDHPWSIKYRK